MEGEIGDLSCQAVGWSALHNQSLEFHRDGDPMTFAGATPRPELNPQASFYW